ncbi:MAG: hypothetical protein K2Q32_09760 [Alphaproteobacteria bacterium]|nr:hypothetical protein [Alphaproteobacteria bacterium]
MSKKSILTILKVGLLIVVGYVVLVYLRYGTISPCGILRVRTQENDKLAAALPKELVEWGMQAQYGTLTPSRCLSILSNR